MITFSKISSTGRLGNQMFEYAAAKSAALNTNSIVSLPIENNILVKYFNLNCKFYSLYQNKDIIKKLNKFNENGFHYNESFINIQDNTDLYGCFQSEKYFKKFEKEIRQEFSFKEHIFTICQSKIDKIKNIYNKKICSLHVRRGDYINLQSFHPLCSLEYYKEAIKNNSECIFLIFSDDIEWCKKNFIGDMYEFSENSSEEVDLCLMSLCDNNIIANSSFSWWAAWLNCNKDKKIISPKNWFGPSYFYHNTKDLYCDNWIKL